MLVVSRKNGEVVRLGNDIVITVIEVKGSRVRVGIDADEEILVLRSEKRVVDEPAREDERVESRATRKRVKDKAA